MIYADNSATTSMSKVAIDAMLPYFNKNYGNASSLYSFGQVAKEALENSREIIAKCLNCEKNEITFVSCGSEADNQAIISASIIGARKGKKHIVSTAFEHHAVLHCLEKLKQQGFEITLLNVNKNGIVSAEQVKNAIREDTCLVTIMFANNEIGTIQPIEEIGKVCKEKGVIFHTDAVQAVGHVHVDVKKQNIDMLSLSAHKFHGPKGIGVLYAKKSITLSTLIEGGAQEKGKRAGTENVASIVAMATALAQSVKNIDKNAIFVSSLRNRLIEGLKEIPHGELNGDETNRLPSNVSFCFEGIEGESLLLLLDDLGICASSGSACTSGSLEPSHVLLAIGRPHEVAHGSLRLTLSEENTMEEVEYIIKSVKNVVAYLRSISPVWHDLESGKRKFIF